MQDVRVKGGTIDGVKAVAGYVHDTDGRPVAFALIANNLASKDETILRIHEDIIKNYWNCRKINSSNRKKRGLKRPRLNSLSDGIRRFPLR